MGEILGLPLHPLVVHSVVVLVPLVAVGMVVAVLSLRWSERLRVVLAVLASVAAAASVVARATGQTLLAQVPGSPEVARHANLSDALPWFLLAVAALIVAWAWLESRGTSRRWLGVVATGGALAATVWTVLAGHTGAESVWGDI